MISSVEEKVVLILGGAGGIGSATARALLGRGAKVALADIDQARLDALVLSLDSDQVRRYVVDVTREDQVKAVAADVVRDFGSLDVVIISAGIMLIRPLAEVNTSEWEATIDLNIKGTLWGIAAVLPIFMQQGSGHVINLGSVHGLKVFTPGGAVHSASKFAIRAISEGLRAEMAGNGIRVTTVTPGAVDTGIQNKTTGADSARILDIYKNAIPASVVADAIVYAIEQPANVDINEIVVRPTAQVI
jgi:NADP-dependent 3-hydroxy acid dehydrogenase YdfG